MNARNSIEESIPYLKSTDTVEFALELMEEYKMEHLPVLEKTKLLGVVSEQQLMEEPPTVKLDKLSFPFIPIAIHQNSHIFDAMKKGFECKSSILPVVDENGMYIGLISPRSLLNRLSEFNFASELGGIFVLEVSAENYSLSEIARLVESNKANILSVATAKLIDSIAKIQITVKVNTLDLTYILATFERYEYNIVAVYHQAEQVDMLQERYDALMNYLNV